MLQKLKQIIIALIITTFSYSASATLITYNDYTLDTETNIVTSPDGLEWLQWDMTVGMSISEALSMYSADGWTLATNIQMSDLFNDFSLGGSTDWDSDENTKQYETTSWTSSEDIDGDPELMLLALFGYTDFSNSNHNGDDDIYRMGVLFGDDSDGDGFYSSALVLDDYTVTYSYNAIYYTRSSSALLDNDYYVEYDTVSSMYGVALVRDTSITSTVEVPEPSSLAIFGMGLLGFAGFSRRKQK